MVYTFRILYINMKVPLVMLLLRYSTPLLPNDSMICRGMSVSAHA